MYDHAPIELHEGEQLVHAVHARIAPTLSEILAIVLFAPVALVIWLAVHRAFRSTTYVITTQRVLAVEKQGQCGEVSIKDIQRLRTFRGAMMIHAAETRLWLPRLPDGWQFETILNRVRQL
ncbi:hypothetical protein [Leisingera sp. ANG-M7]|uniref:hypothetical protein n=1 Tax=Leisingera sp. ANG-M7 TaxID=1577902 RepID=UPI00057E3845|nr:hypothetical protein [Leisingera sp. ANG-M7]KIC36955.1 hypothetical protein RA26_11675 [Leisingera sp. ANG-M7]